MLNPDQVYLNILAWAGQNLKRICPALYFRLKKYFPDRVAKRKSDQLVNVSKADKKPLKDLKWFFCANETSLNNDSFFDLIKVTVLSARQNTSLRPYMIYEGELNRRTNWLKRQGVVIIQHRLSFYEDVTNQEGRGALLRIDIPMLVKKLGMKDKYVLYTDCDVIFMSEPTFDFVKPDFFAAGPQENKNEWKECNSGVLLINIARMVKIYPFFIRFILENRQSIVINRRWDQWAYNTFFRDKWQRLPLEYNWKPYWEFNDQAKIIHFHGPKHTSCQKAIQRDLRPNLLELFDRNPESFKKYSDIAAAFLSSSAADMVDEPLPVKKWFFCTNETSLNKDDFFKLMKVSVLSAKRNTSLNPYLIYEGSQNRRVDWFKQQGVTVIPHRLSFFDELSDHEGRGALLKIDIPTIVKRLGFKDRFVLYTDCDVVFMKDLTFNFPKPKYFACVAQELESGSGQLNSGVLVMNMDGLAEQQNGFIRYILANREQVVDRRRWDKWCYNEYFKGKWDQLPIEYNWKPYNGVNMKAKIVHFHGPKHVNHEAAEERNLRPNLLALYDRNPESFRFYVKIARGYL